MPSVGWLPYYALLCALGAWVVLAAGLVRRPWIALTLLTMLAVLQPVHAATPALEWASDYYQRRAAYFVGGLKRYLLERHPALPPHTRLYFLGVPNGTGIGQPWFNPAFRVWYRDSTLRGDFFRNYAARGAGEPPDRDYFFRFDPGALTWSEVVKGAEDVDRERGANRLWASDHRDLALMLGDAGDWRGAAAEVEKLVSAFPDNPEFRLNLALCLGNLGDTLGAKRTMRSADSLRAAHRVQKKP
jgi:hypothetical protein